MSLKPPEFTGESAQRDLESQNDAVESVSTIFAGAVLQHICETFGDTDYLQRMQRLGVFHRIRALVASSGEDVDLPEADACCDSTTARLFAQRLVHAHDRQYGTWLQDNRSGKTLPLFHELHPQLHRAYTLFLIVGNVARASTWQDWRVDREDDLLTERLGMRGSILDVEAALAEAYTRPGERALHLVKGPGNGITVEGYDMQSERMIVREGRSEPLNAAVDHVRVGDRLYFDIGPILERYIRPELLVPREDQAEEHQRLQAYRHARQAIDILTHALQHRLRDRWGSRLTNQMPNRAAEHGPVAGPDFFDLNEVLRLLQHPNDLFQGVVELGKILDSREYVGDATRTMSLSMRRWVAGYRNRSLSDADADAVEWKRFREEHLMELYGQRVMLEDVLSELSPHRSPRPPSGDRLSEITSLYTQCSGMEVPERERNRDDLLERVVEYLGAVNDDISWLVRLRRNGETATTASAATLWRPSTGGVQNGNGVAALRNIFTDDFVDAVEGADRYAGPEYYRTLAPDDIDLNDHARFVSRNFLPSFFLEFPQKLGSSGKGTVLFLTSVRSDSHEPGDVWRRDILQNLELLQPGGMLVVDGHRESYSRIHRSIPRLPQGYRMWWAQHRESGQPLSLIVQRDHPEQPSLQQNPLLKTRLLAPDSQLVDPEQTLQRRLDLHIANLVRYQVAQCLHDRQEFIGLQQFIDVEVRHRLLRTLCRQLIRDSDPKQKHDMLETIFETVRVRIAALIHRAVEREHVRRSGEGFRPSVDEIRTEITDYFGSPDDAKIPRKADASDLFDLSFKKFRSWMYERFGATQKKGRQHRLQVKEHYSEAILHGMIAALAEHAPEQPELTEEVLWDIARNIVQAKVPCIENPDRVAAELAKETVQRVLKIHASQSA